MTKEQTLEIIEIHEHKHSNKMYTYQRLVSEIECNYDLDDNYVKEVYDGLSDRIERNRQIMFAMQELYEDINRNWKED